MKTEEIQSIKTYAHNKAIDTFLRNNLTASNLKCANLLVRTLEEKILEEQARLHEVNVAIFRGRV